MTALFESEKHAKFAELAEKRTNRALDAIRLIGNLSNRQLYYWDDKEVKKVIRVLRGALSDVEARFKQPARQRGGKFKL